jgi:hypothetical protein
VRTLFIATIAALLAAGTAQAAPPDGNRPRPAKAAAPAPKAKGAKKASKPRKPVEPPEPPLPDPLLGAWSAGGRIQLGNGSLRSEVLVAAMRLLGLRNSFDAGSFIQHVFYVNAVARKDDLDGDWSRRLRSVLRKDRARKGDVILFDVAGSGVLAGVVESAANGRARFIAPINGVVARGTATLAGGKGRSGDTFLQRCVVSKPAPRKKGAKAKASVDRPCRAGDLLLGVVDVEAAARALAR